MTDTPIEFNPPGFFNLTDVESAKHIKYQDDLTDIEGVLSAGAQGGGAAGKHRNTPYDLLILKFIAWCRPGQPVNKNNLVLLRAIDPADNFRTGFKSLEIVRFSVLLSTDETRAIIWKQSEQAPQNDQLTRFAEEFSKPLIIKTVRLGDLELDPSRTSLSGKTTWNEEPIDISIAYNESDKNAAGMAIAQSLFADEQSWAAKVDAYAAEKILPWYNDGWRLDEDPELSKDEFIARIKILSIRIEKNGQFWFYYSDGDLFSGHWVEIGGTLEQGLTHADTPG